MKTLFWTGTAVLILGIASIFVPVPRGIETQNAQVMSPLLSAVMIMGGIGTMAAGKVKT
ncbi:MAG TPA: hypothetical protein VN893_05230 [Bryobacteraceae bacterium]|nr:hypothetical protein [Bryobacteraceae bacterium]